MSASLCVLDAVWSINANYVTTVVPLVRRYAEHHGVVSPVVAPAEVPAVDPIALSVLAATAESELVVLGNKQRTSTRGGITKAAAAIQYARILAEHRVESLRDARALMDDGARLDAVSMELASVRGHGTDGIRLGYLWMLVGDDQRIKPDRMVLRWLGRVAQRPIGPDEARDIIWRVAAQVGNRLERTVTPWEVDHAVWLDERSRA